MNIQMSEELWGAFLGVAKGHFELGRRALEQKGQFLTFIALAFLGRGANNSLSYDGFLDFTEGQNQRFFFHEIQTYGVEKGAVAGYIVSVGRMWPIERGPSGKPKIPSKLPDPVDILVLDAEARGRSFLRVGRFGLENNLAKFERVEDGKEGPSISVFDPIFAPETLGGLQ